MLFFHSCALFQVSIFICFRFLRQGLLDAMLCPWLACFAVGTETPHISATLELGEFLSVPCETRAGCPERRAERRTDRSAPGIGLRVSAAEQGNVRHVQHGVRRGPLCPKPRFTMARSKCGAWTCHERQATVSNRSCMYNSCMFCA